MASGLGDGWLPLDADVGAGYVALQLTTTNDDLRLHPNGDGTVVLAGTTCTHAGQYGAQIGGQNNVCGNADWTATVGGANNDISVGANYAGIFGGYGHTINVGYGVILGGDTCTLNGAYGAVIGARLSSNGAQKAVVAGGLNNSASGTESFVGGGSANAASGTRSSIVGGSSHVANATDSGCFAGYNCNATQTESATLGGDNLTASGIDSVCVGGINCSASGTGAASVGGSGCAAGGDQTATVGGAFASASGGGSVVVGGSYGNTVWERSVVLGGQYCQTNSADCVAMGLGAQAWMQSQFATSGNSEGIGTADRRNSQGYLLHLDERTADDTPSTLKAGVSEWSLPNIDMAFTYTGTLTAWDESNQKSTHWKVEGAVRNVASTPALLYNLETAVYDDIGGADPAGVVSVAVSVVSGTTDYLRWTVTGVAGTNIRWSLAVWVSHAEDND